MPIVKVDNIHKRFGFHKIEISQRSAECGLLPPCFHVMSRSPNQLLCCKGFVDGITQIRLRCYGDTGGIRIIMRFGHYAGRDSLGLSLSAVILDTWSQPRKKFLYRDGPVGPGFFESFSSNLDVEVLSPRETKSNGQIEGT